MDRQDIDALLIGALYGELTPADEARLAAHLESHPADRGALDDLKRTRAAVRDSRILDFQVEPPQAVSALLLQEAHRRAPKRAASDGEQKESWFYRFTRVFMAHPAMAAAAMLVVVVGVAGTLYVNKGDSGFVEQRASAPAMETAAAPQDLAKEEAPAAAESSLEPAERYGEGAAGAPGSAYTVQLDDTSVRTGAPAESARSEQPPAKQKRQVEADKKSRGLLVTTPERTPKDLDEPRARKSAKGAESRDALDDRTTSSVSVADGASIGAMGGAAPTTSAAPRASGRAIPAQPSPPPPSAVAAQKPSAPAPKPAPRMDAEAKSESAPAQDNALIAWARSEHNRTVALASKGDCTAAAKVAVAVQSRAPDYYAQFMASDRLLKKCQAYIAQQRDAEAERANKLRSQKRATSADEPAAAPTKH